jgi:hypothetical protein
LLLVTHPVNLVNPVKNLRALRTLRGLSIQTREDPHNPLNPRSIPEKRISFSRLCGKFIVLASANIEQ